MKQSSTASILHYFIYYNWTARFLLSICCIDIIIGCIGFSHGNGNTNNMLLKDRYLDRLGFTDHDARFFVQIPSQKNLDRLIEAHLEHITFDNLSQHGLPYPACLDVEKTAHKLLDQKRGGFCFELNGLFGELLQELGYTVKRVPAIVHAGPEVGFRHLASHLILIVSCGGSTNDEAYVVDVGFGEPAIHSLRYQTGLEQTTPEGMVSRLVLCKDDPQSVILEWLQPDGTPDGSWSQRLKWEVNHPGQPLANFQEGLDAVLEESSIFHKKLIVCRITRHEKITLAGMRLKRSTPRFGGEISQIEDLPSLEDVQRVLRDTFGVSNTEGLDLTKSTSAAPEMWTRM